MRERPINQILENSGSIKKGQVVGFMYHGEVPTVAIVHDPDLPMIKVSGIITNTTFDRICYVLPGFEELLR